MSSLVVKDYQAMQTTSFEATIVNGQIQVPAGIELPENARLVVTISDPTAARIASPRLVDTSQVPDFVMQVGETPNASL